MRTLTRTEFTDRFPIASGAIDPDAMTLVTIMRDEAFLLPAFLHHWRSIGVEQFVIADDHSTDGTGALLDAAPDVVVLRSDLSYGETVRIRAPLRTRIRRAGILFKERIPPHLFPNRWSLHADADEFLILPPGVRSVRDVAEAARRRGGRAVAASWVDFAPAALSDLDAPHAPRTLDDLLDRAPMFRARPNLRMRRLRQPVAAEADGSGRAPPLKTPLARLGPLVRRYGSHKTTWPPVHGILLTMAHFKYTADTRAKIARALAVGGHLNGGSSYRRLAAHLDGCMPEAPLIGPDAVHYTGPEQLIAAGLMRWPGSG